MSYQSGLPTDNPTFPDRLKDPTKDHVYQFLGVDDDGFGHYWVDSEMLHSMVCRVDEEYQVVDRVNWITEDGVAGYVQEHELQGLSELAEKHLI